MPAARTLAAVIAFSACFAAPAVAGAQAAPATLRAFEIHIVERRVPPQSRVVRATEGERIELHWSADEPLVLHLHGYDLETRVGPGKPAVTSFAARLTGRFPVEIHLGDESKHGHRTLLHVEIHPR